MKQNELLIENIDRFYTTMVGVDRTKRNLKLGTDDEVSYCKDLILNPQCCIARKGKNRYCEIRKTRITAMLTAIRLLLHTHTNAPEKSVGKRELK